MAEYDVFAELDELAELLADLGASLAWERMRGGWGQPTEPPLAEGDRLPALQLKPSAAAPAAAAPAPARPAAAAHR